MLWQVKMNAGLRALGLTYSRFIGTLGKNDIGLNRKMLADLAENNPEVTGDDVDHTRVARFRKRIERVENTLFNVKAVDSISASLNKEGDVRTRKRIEQKRFYDLG